VCDCLETRFLREQTPKRRMKRKKKNEKRETKEEYKDFRKEKESKRGVVSL
jgi:hypothetical protein